MTTTIVKDAAGLTAALKAAQSGDVIKLAAGDYSAISLSGLKYAGAVTVTSLDPDNMAVLQGFVLRDSQNITIQGVEFKVDPAKADNPIQVVGSSNIAFDGISVHGTLNDNPADDRDAMLIRTSKNVSITNSEFQELRNAISHLDNNGLRISDNYFHDLRTDGVRGGGSSNVTVSGNYFTDFFMNDTDHPDAIQFWTTNTTASATNIVVTGNVVTRGEGDPVQGIFFRDQVGTLPYENVTIADNLVVGGMFNGISVNGGRNVVVTGNTVVGLQDQGSRIDLLKVDGGVLSNNVGTDYILELTTGITQSNNKEVATPTDGGKLLQQAWMTAHSWLLGGDLNLLSTTLDGLINVKSLTGAILDGDAAATVSAMLALRATVVTITGTSSGESLSVDPAQDTYIDAGAGNDLLRGGGIGHNTLVGGTGDDSYYVKNPYETVVEKAGEGTDLVIASVDFTLSDNVEHLRMADGAIYGGGNALDNKITGTAKNNRIDGFDGADRIYGLDGDDQLNGGGGNDDISAGVGADTVTGGDGADKLDGESGDDSLAGGAGADTLQGGLGADVLSGGVGADVFQFRQGTLTNTPDRIVDFSRAEGDKIWLSSIDANTLLANDQKFTFIGTSSFHKVAGELRFTVQNGVTTVYADTNGDGAADFSLALPGAGTLQASDFLR